MAPLPALVLVAVVATAGAAVARVLRLPMWPFTGAVASVAVAGGLVHRTIQLPPWWALLAQILVGTAVGARLGPGVLRQFRTVLGSGLAVVLTVIPLGVALGLLVHDWTGLPVRDTLFGLIPGGVGEMVAATAGLGGNSALVAAMHLVRLLVVVWTVRAAVHLIRRGRA